MLVDEYQDVNRASGLLLRELAGDGAGLWVVGDARQAIYRFRGASPINMRRFGQDFPGAVVGVVVLLEGHAECVDLFDRPDTLRVYWNRLVRSYALEAPECKPSKPSMESAARLLRRPGGANVTPFASIGIRTDVRIVGNGVVGAALVHGQTVVHTALFRHHGRDAGSGLQDPRMRARRLAAREQP